MITISIDIEEDLSGSTFFVLEDGEFIDYVSMRRKFETEQISILELLLCVQELITYVPIEAKNIYVKGVGFSRIFREKCIKQGMLISKIEKGFFRNSNRLWFIHNKEEKQKMQRQIMRVQNFMDDQKSNRNEDQKTLALLIDHQWAGRDRDGDSECPECGNFSMMEKHDDKCLWAERISYYTKAIADLKEEADHCGGLKDRASL